MKHLALCALAALTFLMSFVNESYAQRRCGDFIHNGTIYVSSRARDCDRGTGWRGDGRWGPTGYYAPGPRQRAYYESRPRYRKPNYAAPVAPTQPRPVSTVSLYAEPGPGPQMPVGQPQRSTPVYEPPAKPVQASADSCPRVPAQPVQNNLCRRNPGDVQLSWNGRSDWCLGARPSPNAYVCFNKSTGRLAWYTP